MRRHTITKIISGGQTGADRGALLAARELGIETGGAVPKGWLTENGPQEALLRGLGLVECEEEGYPARTRRNVANSDGTLLVGQHARGGSRLTFEEAQRLSRPLFVLVDPAPHRIPEFQAWLETHQIRILNVAGNRESESSGIAELTRRFLLSALTA